MQQLEPTKPANKGGGKMNLMIALFVALFIIWAIYTGTQTQRVDSRSMPANMPGMNSDSTAVAPTEMPANMPGMNSDSTAVAPTEMPADMPGMNHP